MPHDEEEIAQTAGGAETRTGVAVDPHADPTAGNAAMSRDLPAAGDLSAERLMVADVAEGAADLGIETGIADTPEDPEDGRMLDVHPPHEGIHSWKQYLLHMSTIVLGLLIAIGLEQSVEWLHRANERRELRESLQRESDEAIRAAKSSEAIDVPSIEWIDTRRKLIEDALATHRAFTAPLPKRPHVDSVQPSDPAWNAAKSSGMLSLLTQNEVEVYSLADQLIAASQSAFEEGVAGASKRGQFEYGHSLPNDPTEMDLSKATPAELGQYRDLLADEATAWTQYRVLCEYVRGVETAIHGGERDIEKVQQAKTTFSRRARK